MAGIRNSDAIPIETRDYFISEVFWNLLDIIDVTTRLRDALSKRQKQHSVVREITDIFKKTVPLFEPFVEYGAHQIYGKYEFEKEKSNNLAFSQVVEVRTRTFASFVWADSSLCSNSNVSQFRASWN